MAKLPWKPWHEVVKLREDLRNNQLPLHLFAADLYEVLMQRGKRPTYENPQEFFALTFPTYNLRQLVRDVVLRLAGKNDKAVRQLELTYGGGKTHTLITLRHLVHDPATLPDLPSVGEFTEGIGQKPPKCRVAGLCFDKLDVEKGMKVLSPDGTERTLKQPWSVLAYQIAGDDGLKLLHAKEKAEERDSAPAENLLVELLELPGKQGLGTLILIDEVLMYAREKAAQDKESRSKLINFFQYLTQAAVKVDRCCIVASLLATDPLKSDELGKQIQGDLYDIFQRQREAAVEPVVKEDVAEVLRRRFFTPESLKDQAVFRQHVMAATKGIAAVDEQTAKQGSETEERFLKSFPFHPDLTEVLYSKWTQLARFQRTRGVLRTFALALRDAEKWDTSPLIGPTVFLSAPGKSGSKSGASVPLASWETDGKDATETVAPLSGLSESLREMVAIVDTEETEGRKQAWTGILDNEFTQARHIQDESVGLKNREIEQAVVTTFLHSQPTGQSAKIRDLFVLLGQTRPDKIELEKGLTRWAQASYWLDDQFAAVDQGTLPGTWRLGNRPNLTQMHAVATKNVSDDVVRARLFDDISKLKTLTNNASAAGVRVHTLPPKPKDIEDDGCFHYAVLGPDAASESGKPSAMARRFLDETTGSDRPRVNRNAVLLLVPSKDGYETAAARVREYIAWETVREEIKKQQKEGNVDSARAHTLQINIETAKTRIPEAIKQAYCIVVTISEKDEPQAFKITITDEPHFNIIKADKRSRVQDTAIAADAILPGGPYDLWHSGETARRVKDLAGAFSQIPHLPKMLKASAILDTLADGCENGAFVLRLVRPDKTFRTWWMSRPDEQVLDDSALELHLPAAAELSEIPSALMAPGKLPKLWEHSGASVPLADSEKTTGTVAPLSEITEKNACDYFGGSTVVHVDRDGYQEPVHIPKASQATVDKAIADAVQDGIVWLLSGPSTFLGETVPVGVLNANAKLCMPPAAISAPEILPENLPDAWSKKSASAMSIATALTMKSGKALPWKTVRDVISAALSARFLQLSEDSHDWPCEFPSAQHIKLKVASGERPRSYPGQPGGEEPPTTMLVATAVMETCQIQDLGDNVQKLQELKSKTNTPIQFELTVRLGDGKTAPTPEVTAKFNALLKNVSDKLILKY